MLTECLALFPSRARTQVARPAEQRRLSAGLRRSRPRTSPPARALAPAVPNPLNLDLLGTTRAPLPTSSPDSRSLASLSASLDASLAPSIPPRLDPHASPAKPPAARARGPASELSRLR